MGWRRLAEKRELPFMGVFPLMGESKLGTSVSRTPGGILKWRGNRDLLTFRFLPTLCKRSLDPGWANIWKEYFLHHCSSQMTIRLKTKSWVSIASITLCLMWWVTSDLWRVYWWHRLSLLGHSSFTISPFYCCLYLYLLFTINAVMWLNSIIYIFAYIFLYQPSSLWGEVKVCQLCPTLCDPHIP